ncbi:MAG: DUF6174 domain-containing protein [Pseudomonadota bacterium]
MFRSLLGLLLLAVGAGCTAQQPRQTQDDVATAMRTWREQSISKYSFQIQYLYKDCEWAKVRVRHNNGETKATILELNAECADHLQRVEESYLTRDIVDLFVETITFFNPPLHYLEYSTSFDARYGYPVNVKVDTDWPARGENGEQEWEYEYRIFRFNAYE